VLVKHIRSFAEDLNMKTVAEFVCSEAIAEAVREIGIDYSQGYHFHKPSPREQLPKA
jgi:EAL domain-containing protein (putative c-di-GMP-specific phosphodiesterase class I)